MLRVWLSHGLLVHLAQRSSLHGVGVPRESKGVRAGIDELAQTAALATPQSPSHDETDVVNVHTNAGCSHQD